jgi:tetrahedral aminopeptidase
VLAELSNLRAVSGNEDSVRRFILDKLADARVDTTVDTMGNLLVRKGKSDDRPIMLSAHMDEVGFMVITIEKNGLLKFKPVGGIDSRVLVGKRVRIGKEGLPGVIGVKPVHLQKKNEQENPFKADSLYIDAGFINGDEAGKSVTVGDYASFDAECVAFGDGFYRGKAFDDRAGCLILLKLLLEENDLTFTAAFTVQEEVGTRGAAVAAYTLNPRIAMVVEATAAGDTPETEEEASGTILGAGPAISLMDRTIIVSRKLRDEIAAVAEKASLPYQYRRFTGAGTEGGAIALSREGVETAVVSIPCRYIHSPHSVLKESDLKAAFSLVRGWLELRQ